ncbi:MAG: phosphoenolpyruvate--protein phosphotransferase [Lachnospiraceae bacterium]|nr:phosphoenolpyruvate--protein phosphotransferase [Lachnospiraceae bacterium]
MTRLQGTGVVSGIAIGELTFYEKEAAGAHKRTFAGVDSEEHRFNEAVSQLDIELIALKDAALSSVGSQGVSLFEAYRMILQDLLFLEQVGTYIRRDYMCAEDAVLEAGKTLAATLLPMEDAYLKQRAEDVKAVAQRLYEKLVGDHGDEELEQAKGILAAQTLTPAEMMHISRENVSAIVLENAAENSHIAILAGLMDIPMIVGVRQGLGPKLNGLTAIADAERGALILSPTEEVLTQSEKRRVQLAETKELLQQYAERDTVTQDGKRIRIEANISGLVDLDGALQYNVDGVGLFRTEFLFLGRKEAPSEEQQYRIYRKVAERMGDRPVVIRIMDLGADKMPDYLKTGEEENPAMGLRGIRFCLEKKGLLRTQLSAILRAAVYGRASLLIPMVVSLSEVLQVREMLEDVKRQLTLQGEPFRMVPVGVMIETPAAALISDTLAQNVDFFSVGTNDLTQYTTAMDRQNVKLKKHMNPYHPAVFRLIRMTVDSATRAGIPVSICGELAADTTLCPYFLSIGVTALSVSPMRVLTLRKTICELRVDDFIDRNDQWKEYFS